MSSGSSPQTASAIVIGVGNAWAGDDAAGLLVARMVRQRAPVGIAVIEHEGEPIGLLEAWDGARLAIVVDATSSGSPPGTVRVIDATREPMPARFAGTSTHAFGLPQTIELGRTLGRLPGRLLIVGIEGTRFTAGTQPTAAVAAALEPAAARVLSLVDPAAA
jgi:hydrogenase maturation protease